MNQPNPNSSCVVVLGPYRSGTSITARVLQRLGVNFGPDDAMFEGNGFNPGGYYERADINRANTEFIRSAGKSLAEPGDPAHLSKNGNPDLLRSVDLSWRDNSALWGIKDPRMCATLGSWLSLGLLDARSTRIVLVVRAPEQITKSVLEFPQVRDYCDGTPEGASSMVSRYLTLANTFVAETDIPHFRLRYEDLITRKHATITAMADFLGVRDDRLIREAEHAIGKRRSQIKLWAFEYPRRAIRKLSRLLAGAPKKRRF